MNHEWKNVDSGTKTRDEHIDVLNKYGIGSLIHISCKKIEERTCSNCKKIVSVSQIDENNKMILGTLVVRNINFTECEVK